MANDFGDGAVLAVPELFHKTDNRRCDSRLKWSAFGQDPVEMVDILAMPKGSVAATAGLIWHASWD